MLASASRLERSCFTSLTKLGVDWYSLVMSNSDLKTDYNEYINAKSDYVTVNIDYSQLEVYVLASLSGDPKLIAAVNSGMDIHDLNTKNIYGLDKAVLEAELGVAIASGDTDAIVSAEMALDHFKMRRKFIKALTFSLTYGAGANKIAMDLQITEAEANKLIEDFYTTYPGVKKWQDLTFLNAIKVGYVETPYKRRRGTPKIYRRMDAYQALAQNNFKVIKTLRQSKEYSILRSDQKVCKNTPVQSTATDLCSLAACKVNNLFKNNPDYLAEFMFWVHDALVFSCHIDTAVDNILRVVDIMENATKLPGDKVNYRAEADIGYNYEYMASIKRKDIFSTKFTKELLLSKLDESLTADLDKKFQLIIKATGVAMDTIGTYIQYLKETKGDYFDDMVQNLGVGVSSPDEYMSSLHQMTLTEYILAEETKFGDDIEDDEGDDE